jgi:hypothetical protein
VSRACNIFKDGGRWCLTHDGASAWSDSLANLQRFATDAGYEVSYRHPDAAPVLDHILYANLCATVLRERDEGALGISWVVTWLVEHHPDLARLMLADAAGAAA